MKPSDFFKKEYEFKFQFRKVEEMFWKRRKEGFKYSPMEYMDLEEFDSKFDFEKVQIDSNETSKISQFDEKTLSVLETMKKENKDDLPFLYSIECLEKSLKGDNIKWDGEKWKPHPLPYMSMEEFDKKFAQIKQKKKIKKCEKDNLNIRQKTKGSTTSTKTFFSKMFKFGKKTTKKLDKKEKTKIIDTKKPGKKQFKQKQSKTELLTKNKEKPKKYVKKDSIVEKKNNLKEIISAERKRKQEPFNEISKVRDCGSLSFAVRLNKGVAHAVTNFNTSEIYSKNLSLTNDIFKEKMDDDLYNHLYLLPVMIERMGIDGVDINKIYPEKKKEESKTFFKDEEDDDLILSTSSGSNGESDLLSSELFINLQKESKYKATSSATCLTKNKFGATMHQIFNEGIDVKEFVNSLKEKFFKNPNSKLKKSKEPSVVKTYFEKGKIIIEVNLKKVFCPEFEVYSDITLRVSRCFYILMMRNGDTSDRIKRIEIIGQKLVDSLIKGKTMSQVILIQYVSQKKEGKEMEFNNFGKQIFYSRKDIVDYCVLTTKDKIFDRMSFPILPDSREKKMYDETVAHGVSLDIPFSDLLEFLVVHPTLMYNIMAYLYTRDKFVVNEISLLIAKIIHNTEKNKFDEYLKLVKRCRIEYLYISILFSSERKGFLKVMNENDMKIFSEIQKFMKDIFLFKADLKWGFKNDDFITKKLKNASKKNVEKDWVEKYGMFYLKVPKKDNDNEKDEKKENNKNKPSKKEKEKNVSDEEDKEIKTEIEIIKEKNDSDEENNEVTKTKKDEKGTLPVIKKNLQLEDLKNLPSELPKITILKPFNMIINVYLSIINFQEKYQSNQCPIWPGDSGSGVFIKYNGESRLIGVQSLGHSIFFRTSYSAFFVPMENLFVRYLNKITLYEEMKNELESVKGLKEYFDIDVEKLGNTKVVEMRFNEIKLYCSCRK